MKSSLKHSKINGRHVWGQGYLQPSVNDWIGIFIVPEDLLGDPVENWESTIISYEGAFLGKKDWIKGKGKAKIIYAKSHNEKYVRIHVEGIDEPILEENKIAKKPQ
ncbi:MAG TPA: hypothetical protein VE868_12430, partial [Balneolaceae bacterium]|nr:hypothetical protein [Balneolaceae bacterium]